MDNFKDSKNNTKLSPEEEKKFNKWYSGMSKKYNLDPNPDDHRHYYDYRGAFKAGVTPGPDKHWDSRFKVKGHPRMVVDGVNTKTGEKVDKKNKFEKLRSKLGI